MGLARWARACFGDGREKGVGGVGLMVGFGLVWFRARWDGDGDGKGKDGEEDWNGGL